MSLKKSEGSLDTQIFPLLTPLHNYADSDAFCSINKRYYAYTLYNNYVSINIMFLKRFATLCTILCYIIFLAVENE